MERITRGSARWFFKCHKCRKPWAVELPHVKIREISGFDLPEYPGGPRKARYTLRDDYGPVTAESEKPCPLCGAISPTHITESWDECRGAG